VKSRTEHAGAFPPDRVMPVWRTVFARVWANPAAAVAVSRMLAYGWYVRLSGRLRGRRLRLGRNFRVLGGVDVRGPGRVVFGDDCTVISSGLAPVTLYTETPEAIIQIGNRVVLNGTRFGCYRRIEVGDDCLLADARIADSDFHDVDPKGKHRWQTRGEASPVTIGPNVWVCSAALVLKGVRIGADAVVAAAAVVTHDVSPGSVVAGNPARVVREVSAQHE
jgi:acetyltransferase-like isoleucine patch superfamily enzyme